MDDLPPRTDVVAAVFEDHAAAVAAQEALVAQGVPADAITVLHRDNPLSREGMLDGVRTAAVPHNHAHGYADAVNQGYALMFVHAAPDRQDAVMAMLEARQPVDVMVRGAGWARPDQPPANEAPAQSQRLLFEDAPARDHMPATGLLNETDVFPLQGDRLVNPMGIEVPGIRTTGSHRVRRYRPDPDAVPVDDI